MDEQRRGRVTVREDAPGPAVVVLSGEADMVTDPLLQAALRSLLRAGRPVVIDTTGCEFMDSAGLAAILDARRRYPRAGLVLVIVPGGPVELVMALSGVLADLTHHATLEAALTAASEEPRAL